MKIKDWNNREIKVVQSAGGVIAIVNPYDNLVSTNIFPWPPSEIIQKLYKSRQERAFGVKHRKDATSFIGYYSDLQSVHSEDAITWSIFGTIAYAETIVRNRWIQDLLKKIGEEPMPVKHSNIFLWRRTTHPDTFVSGGPEIDFGIYTGNILLLGEAKWLSSVGTNQGKKKDKDQIQLRVEFLNKFANQLYNCPEKLILLGVGLKNDIIKNCMRGNVQCKGITWDEVCDIASHPLANELRRYLDWKKNIKK